MEQCGKYSLDIKTYIAGKNQITHPNVVSFEQPWHGYLHYMAYTPYPYANGSEENPSIAASNDLIHWEKPYGLINPIAHCIETETDELKDTHLLYRSDLDRLECWYLGRIQSTINEGGPLHVLRKVSADGISWSKYEVIYTFKDFNLTSPSVIWNGNYYDYWGIRNSKQDIALYHINIGQQNTPPKLTRCLLPDIEATNMWHGSVALFNDKYNFVWMGKTGIPSSRIYYAASSDKFTFSSPEIILEDKKKIWAHFYRPDLHYYNDKYYLFYGVVSIDNRWLVSLNIGDDIGRLLPCEGLDGDNAGNIKLRLRLLLNRWIKSFNPRFFILFPPVVAGQMFYPELTLQVWFVMFFICACTCRFRHLYSLKDSIRTGLITATAIISLASFIVMIFHC